MDCTNARLLLPFQRAGELDAAENAALMAHLDSCPDCAALAESERRLDDALCCAMQRVPVPAGLQQRIRTRLAQAKRPRPWAWAAAAAALLLAAGLGGYFYWPRPHGLDMGYFVNATDSDPEKVQEFYADLGVPMTPPAQFDYRLLERADVAHVQGQRVAHLCFFNGGDGQRSAVAHVYVLPRAQFARPDTQHWPEGIPIPTSSHTLQILTSQDHFYLILYTGGSLAPFLGAGI